MTLEKVLSAKLDSLREMLEISKEIRDLAGAEELTDEVLERLSSCMQLREDLMLKVDAFDAQLTKSVGQKHQRVDLEIEALLQELWELQSEINEFLAQKKSILQGQVNKLRTSRRGIKGYYNKQVATKSSFVDDKR